MNDAEKLKAAGCRVENVIWIQGAVADPYHVPRCLEDRILDILPENEGAAIYKQLPVLKHFSECLDWISDLSIALKDTEGFFFEASRCCAKPDWSMWKSEWLYAKDTDSIAQVTIEWALGLDLNSEVQS